MAFYEVEHYPEDGYTHYLNVGALHALFTCNWWRWYRPRLMAAYPWKITWREYTARYCYWQELHEALGRALAGTTRGPEGPPSRRGVSASPKS